jgi:MFS family permease
MLPMRFFRSRAFAAGNAGIFLALASLFGAVFLVAQYFQVALGYGPLETGLRMLPWTGLVMFVAPLTGALADRFGERPFMVAGLTLQAIGMAWIGLVAEPGLAYSALVVPLLLSGVGISMAIIAAQSSVVGSVATEAIGKASGTNTMMRELGGVFGIAIGVAIFAGAGSFVSAEAFTDGFAPAMGGAAALAASGAIVSMGLPGRRARAEAATPPPVPAFEVEGGP